MPIFQPVSFFIGLRYSRSQSRSGFVSFITFFSIAGIFLGVASLIMVVAVMNGFEGELKKRILGLVPHVVVSQPSISSAKVSLVKENTMAVKVPKKYSWQQKRAFLFQQPHVKQVTPFLESEALIQSAKTLQGVLLQGIIPEYEQNNIITSHLVAGSLQSLTEQPYSLVLGQALAQKLEIRLGDTVRMVLPNRMVFTPMGRVPVQRSFTVSGIFNVGSQIDDTMVYVHSKYGAKLLRRKGDGIEQLRLYLDDAFNAEQVVKQLILSPDERLKDNQYITWQESQGALFSAVNMEKNMMWLMLSLIVAVAAFNIVSALVMVVIDKQGEIGILQTLGMDRLGIMKIFMTQGMINGLWGVVLGGVLGITLTLNLNSVLEGLGLNILGAGYANQQLPVHLVTMDVVVIILSALAMSFVATLYPAYRASTTQPAEVLRNE
jgi:lipoprotein-releasing system permease protein